MTAQIVRLKPWPYPSNPEDRAGPEWSPIAGVFVAREHGPKPLAITIARWVLTALDFGFHAAVWIGFALFVCKLMGKI